MSTVDDVHVDFREAVEEELTSRSMLGDDQFSQAVIATAVRRILAAWVDAVTGRPEELVGMASPNAVKYLLNPPTGLGKLRRLVVLDPRISRVEVVGLDADAAPPTLKVEIRLIARWWIADPDSGAISSGYPDADTEVWVRWTLAFEVSGPIPWRLVAGSAHTADEIFGYRYVTREETPEEYRARTSGADPIARPALGQRRYLISADWVEHDERTSGTTSFVVDLGAAPTREQAADLAGPVIEESFGRSGPDADAFNPALTSLEAVELLDADPPTATNDETGGRP